MACSLVAKNLQISRGKTVVVDNFSAELKSGEIVAMVGRNGAGKSTIMSVLTGNLVAASGTVSIASNNDPKTDDAASSVAFVSQGRPLYTGITVKQHVQLAKDLNENFKLDWATEKITSLRIPMNAKISQLSGGQHTQVALIIALARGKRFMVLDEPMADLDPVVKIWVRKLLEYAAKEENVGILVSSHTVSDLSPVLSHLWVIEHGELLVSVPRETIENEEHGDFEKFVLDHLTKEGI